MVALRPAEDWDVVCVLGHVSFVVERRRYVSIGKMKINKLSTALKRSLDSFYRYASWITLFIACHTSLSCGSVVV